MELKRLGRPLSF